MPLQYPQPVELNIPAERLKREFLKITHNHISDPAWHFEIGLHQSSRLAPPDATPPAAGQGIKSLTLFSRPDPPCDIEIYGQHILAEVDPADWLDLYLASQPFEVLSRRRTDTPAGAGGDVILRWTTDGQVFVGRMVCFKAGYRLVLMWLRTAEEHYARAADEFFVALMTFRFLNDATGPLAEKVRWIGRPAPTPWRVAVPVSWQVQEEPASDAVASFQASLIATGAQQPVLVAKLSFALISSDRPTTPEECFEKMGAVLIDAGLSLSSPPAFNAIPPYGPYAAAWHHSGTAALNGNPVAVHANLLRHPKAWLSSIVVGPTREQSAAIWMQCRRLLGVLSMTLELQ